MHKLYVCQTCRRDERLGPGDRSRGARLSEALARDWNASAIEGALMVRVACLNGCLHPCNVALRAPKKYGLRLSNLNADDAPAVLQLLRAYARDASGEVADAAWPAGLRDRMSACVPPPHLLAAGASSS